VGPRVLFNGHDIYDVVEIQKDKLKKTYEALPDDQALDEAFTQDLKKQYMLDIPRLRPDEWTSERKDTPPHANEVVVYVPFDGDPSVFAIKPSASNGIVAKGEIVGHELLIGVIPPTPDFDVERFVRREIGQVEWRLNSLRGSMQHMTQQLEATIRGCIAIRKRSVEHKAKIDQNLNIPRRQSPPVLAAEPKWVPPTQPAAPVKPVQETWDIFMSHATPDKPYVEPLVDELKNAGVSVWYDKHVLSWGDGLRSGINKGLVNSRYAIVVLSKAFLAERKWTEHELNGLFAREELGKLIILPIWHGIDRGDLLKYDPALADRLAKISNTDSYPDIVDSVLEKLGRATPVKKADINLTQPIKDGVDQRELVAYAWYETKGPGAKKEKLYVRKSAFMKGWFVLVDGQNGREGTMEDVSGKFIMADRWLKGQGYVRMNFSNPSNLPAFEL
jgi:hypothetical protein